MTVVFSPSGTENFRSWSLLLGVGTTISCDNFLLQCSCRAAWNSGYAVELYSYADDAWFDSAASATVLRFLTVLLTALR